MERNHFEWDALNRWTARESGTTSSLRDCSRNMSRSQRYGSRAAAALTALVLCCVGGSPYAQREPAALELTTAIGPQRPEENVLLLRIKNIEVAARAICVGGTTIVSESSGTGSSMSHSCDSVKAFQILLPGESAFVSLGLTDMTDVNRVLSLGVVVTSASVTDSRRRSTQKLAWQGSVGQARKNFDELFRQ
jgi:hypothetical protein